MLRNRLRNWQAFYRIVFASCVGFLPIIGSAQEAGQFSFRDRTADLGLELGNGSACWVDVDQDGWTDLCSAGTVWRNEAGKRFSKLATGVGEVVAADFDNDGYPDLFSWSSMQLFHNEQGKSFSPFKLPQLPKSVSLGACWADMNGDGFVDIYLGGYEDWDAGITYPDLLLLNGQGKEFKLAWSDQRFRARGVTACDFDQDGDIDIYVSNYRLQPNLLWRNDGGGKLEDVARELNAVATSPGFDGGHSIGACWGDFDNDGLFDLFAGNFAHVDGRGDQPKSRFLRNLGPAAKYAFEDRGPCGVHYQESYASPAEGDIDNDGKLDLFFTTVYETASFGVKNNPTLFHNDGGFVFSDRTAAAGLGGLPPTYQSAFADFDHDGDIDLVTAGRLFENQSPARHWLAVQLAGNGKNNNRSAVGAQVRLRTKGDQVLARQVEAGTGQGCQNDLMLHFGIGDLPGPYSLEVTWPGGSRQLLEQVSVDQILKLDGGR
ncbi:MAG: CRTAC1 family protein [Planctomycetes bacterium]|nr:CRTAC1 family protein [Planctomycetota bacterium]